MRIYGLPLAFLIFTPLLLVILPVYGTSLEQTLTFDRSAFQLVPQKGFTKIFSPGIPSTEDYGKPEFPEEPIYLLLPPGTRAAGVRIFDVVEEILPGAYRIFPKQKPVSTSEADVWTEPDHAAYTSVAPYPEDVIRLTGQGDFHGKRIACLLVHPYRYVPRDGKLSFVSQMRIVLDLEVDYHPSMTRLRAFSEDEEKRENVLRGIIANSQALGTFSRPSLISSWNKAGGFTPSEEPSPFGSPVRYVIITNEAMAPVFQAVADYKTRIGVPAVVRTVNWIKAHYPRGVDDAETIRDFLKDAYQNWGTNYVLLGGDCNIVPIRYILCWGDPNTPGDYYYQCLDGSWDENHNGVFGEANGDTVDLFPELKAGRACVGSPAEALVFVNKTLRYLAPQDRSFQTTFLLIGQSVFNPGDGAEWCNMIASFAPPEFRMIRLFEPDYCQGNLCRDSVLQYFDQGPGLIYSQTHGQATKLEVRGHERSCKELLTRTDLDALVNGVRTPFWYSVNCHGNAVDLDCVGEHFMGNPNGGGVAYYGATRNMYPDPYGVNMDWVFFDSLFSRGHLRVGEAANDSKIPFIGNSQGDTPYRLLTVTGLLQGDADLAVWATTPKVLTLDFPRTLPLSPLSVKIRASSLLGPVSGVRVTLSKPGEVYTSGFTDSRGEVSLQINPQTPGEVEVAGRKDNFLVTEGTAFVYPQDPFVTAFRQRLQEDTSSVSSGNGNGVLEAGETAALWLTLKNTGGDVARGVRTTLRTSDPHITLLDSSFTVPQAIAPGDTFVSLVPLRFRVSPEMPDGRTVSFLLVTQDSSNRTFPQDLKLDCRAPVLTQVGQLVDDDDIPPTQGNGNGMPEPGETVGLVLTLKNYGGGQEEGVEAQLTSPDSLVVVLDSTSHVGRIPPYGELRTGAAEELLFKVRKQRIGEGYRFSLKLQDAYGRRKDRSFEVVPMRAPGLLWDEPDSASILLHWDPLPDPKAYRYNLYRAEQAGGPYQKVNPDLLASSRFTDSGLPRGQTNYYAATTVDTSLNESVYSMVLAAATYPLNRTGWPRPMSTEFLATPVVCDVDPSYPGKEVIAASLDNRIYAWHADGTGLLNPDGLFKTVPGANFFVTSPAAGDLDGDRIPEIVECTFICDTPRVFVWKANGNNLAGWPKSLQGNACHASPVLYDLDGDSWPEVIAATMSGRVYVWRRDGTGYRDTSGLFAVLADSAGVVVLGTPAVGDINGDGRPEVVVPGGPSKKLFAFDYEGNPIPNFPVQLDDQTCSSPALGDLDPSFPGLEIVTVTRGNQVHVLRGDGQEVREWPQFVNINEKDASPTVADLDGDGTLEVVFPGIYQVYAFRANGTPFPGFPVGWFGTAFSSISVGDIEGNGGMELVVGGGDEKAYAWYADGKKMLGFPIATGGIVKSSPILCDLGDLRVTTLLGSYSYTLNAWQTMTSSAPVRLEWWTFHHDEWRTGQYGFIPPRLGVEELLNSGSTPTLPQKTALFPSAPNPVVTGASIHYHLARECAVNLTVYNVAGERVKILVRGKLKPGYYNAVWNGRDEKGVKVASGIYFYRLQAGSIVLTRKLVVTR